MAFLGGSTPASAGTLDAIAGSWLRIPHKGEVSQQGRGEGRRDTVLNLTRELVKSAGTPLRTESFLAFLPAHLSISLICARRPHLTRLLACTTRFLFARMFTVTICIAAHPAPLVRSSAVRCDRCTADDKKHLALHARRP